MLIIHALRCGCAPCSYDPENPVIEGTIQNPLTVKLCPLHAAAEPLREALLELMEVEGNEPADTDIARAVWEKADNAIQASRGPGPEVGPILIVRKGEEITVDNVLLIEGSESAVGLQYPTTGLFRDDDTPGIFTCRRANCGNRVFKIPYEDVKTKFDVVPLSTYRDLLRSGYRLVKVGFDFGPEGLEAYWNGARWNGWICPLMTPDQFRAMIPMWQADPDYKLIENEDGSWSPPEGWCMFDVVEDEDGYAAFYFVNGQEGDRKLGDTWYENCTRWDNEKRGSVPTPREEWKEVEPLPLEQIQVGEKKIAVIDVSCGLTWQLEEDPIGTPAE